MGFDEEFELWIDELIGEEFELENDDLIIKKKRKRKEMQIKIAL